MLSIAWLIFAALMLVAAVFDVATYRIPNLLVLVVLLVFAALAIIHSDEVAWLNHAGAFILVLGAGLFLYSIGQMGAGDAKLLAAVALWSGVYAGPGVYPIIALLFWVSLCGLAGMLMILVLRHLAPRFSEPTSLPRVLQKKQGIPYGIGIGPGAIIASLSFPPWLWQQ